MCGICGKLVFGDSEPLPDRKLIRQMCDMIVYRGPDSEGIVELGRGALGARRLRIIDLSTGDQPQANEDRSIWVTFNGEIYNFLELRQDLLVKGHQFISCSDTEVLVHLYEEYGDEFVSRCNGMFAFCIYDVRRNRMLLARDRLGKKPLFYFANDRYFVFGSELKTLFASGGVPRMVNLDSIQDYMMFGFVHAPLTAFEDVYQLEPAHYMIVENGKIEKHCYWCPDYTHPVFRKLEDARDEYLELLKVCVHDRLISDVPIGLLLSGGIDSCSIAAMMGEMGVDIPAFTIRFGEKGKDEGEIASLMAKKVGARHTELVIEMEDAIGLLPQLVWHYEQPFSDPSAIPSYYVARLARENVTVALNGDGGDECFGGYWGHLAANWVKRLRIPLLPVWHVMENAFVKNRLRSLDVRSSSLVHMLSLASQWVGESDFETAWKWLSSKAILRELEQSGLGLLPNLQPPVLGRLNSNWSDAKGADYINRILYICNVQFHLPDDLLVKMDRASMANSLEVRSPFLDHRMIEFSASLPAGWKVRGFTTKWFPKYAMKKYLPAEVLMKRKTGFGIPLREWMRGDFGTFAREMILSDRAINRELFPKQALIGMFDLHATNQLDCSSLLYRLLILELWFRTYIDDFKPLSFAD